MLSSLVISSVRAITAEVWSLYFKLQEKSKRIDGAVQWDSSMYEIVFSQSIVCWIPLINFVSLKYYTHDQIVSHIQMRMKMKTRQHQGAESEVKISQLGMAVRQCCGLWCGIWNAQTTDDHLPIVSSVVES